MRRREGAIWLACAGILQAGCGTTLNSGKDGAPPLAPPADGADEHAHVAALLGSSDFQISRVYRTGFESTDDFFGSYVEASGHLGSTFHQLDEVQVHGGKRSHHAWITGANPVQPPANTSHRGYPTFQFQRLPDGPFVDRVLVELWVWLDVALAPLEGQEWFSFATVTSYADAAWPRVLTLNLDAAGHLYLMHVPGQSQSVHDLFQSDTIAFPQRRWVRLSLLVDYTAANAHGSPYAAAWQDGQLVSAARFDPRVDPASVPRELWPPCLAGWDGQAIEDAEARCHLVYRGGLVQAHFGMYAAPLLAAGTVFNDDLVVYELRR
jgi:hypothetical protein